MKTIVEHIRNASFKRTFSIRHPGHRVIVLLISGRANQHIEISVRLIAQSSSVDIIGLTKAKNVDRVTLQTLQYHKERETSSNLLVKSLLKDNATFVYDGAIRVEPSAQKTDAYQRNENLLLSKDAHAQSKPKLEILANDVRCTHGATIGSVREDDLWYLATRGIGKQDATRLIAQGFLASVMTKITDSDALSAVYSFVHRGV